LIRREMPNSAVLYHLADGTKAKAVSAGNKPGSRAHPEVVAATQEIGIDLSAATPQKLTQELANDAPLLITMGCGDKCPTFRAFAEMTGRCPTQKAVRRMKCVRCAIISRLVLQGLIQAEGLEKEAV
jgi:arsenate reductase